MIKLNNTDKMVRIKRSNMKDEINKLRQIKIQSPLYYALLYYYNCDFIPQNKIMVVINYMLKVGIVPFDKRYFTGLTLYSKKYYISQKEPISYFSNIDSEINISLSSDEKTKLWHIYLKAIDLLDKMRFTSLYKTDIKLNISNKISPFKFTRYMQYSSNGTDIIIREYDKLKNSKSLKLQLMYILHNFIYITIYTNISLVINTLILLSKGYTIEKIHNSNYKNYIINTYESEDECINEHR